MFDVGAEPTAFNASSAASSATIGDLSSDAERAKIARVPPLAAHDGLERIRLIPFRGIDRLTVVVAVEENRPRRPGHVERAVDQRVALRSRGSPRSTRAARADRAGARRCAGCSRLSAATFGIASSSSSSPTICFSLRLDVVAHAARADPPAAPTSAHDKQQRCNYPHLPDLGPRTSDLGRRTPDSELNQHSRPTARSAASSRTAATT